MSTSIRRRLAMQVLCLMGFVYPFALSYAGGFTISPVRLELSDARRVGSFTIRNDATSPVTIDVRAVQWTQNESSDDYNPTRDIIITPMIFSLEPGASQVIRVGLRRESNPTHELAYRLFLTEIPAAAATPQAGIAMTLRLSVPLFLKPKIPATPRVEWTLNREAADVLRLTAKNVGTAHIQLANLELKHGEDVVAKQSAPAYLLPGSSREWRLVTEKPFQNRNTPLRLEGYSDFGDLQEELSHP